MPNCPLYLRQNEDLFHQPGHFGACEIFDLRGKALHHAAQIVKAVGAFGAFALLVIPSAVFKALELVRLLPKLLFRALLFGMELFKGLLFRRCD